jgi:hypothetical protein
MNDSFHDLKSVFILEVGDEPIYLVRRLGSTSLDQQHNKNEDEELLWI